MQASWSFLHWLDSQEVDLILRYTIGAEVVLILAAALVIATWKRWTIISARQMRRGLKEALVMFKKHIANGEDKTALSFPYESKSTYFLLKMVHGLDDLTVANPAQEKRRGELRRHIMESVVYLRARELTQSRYPSRRALALACYRLRPRLEDEAVYLAMMKDEVSIIRMGAARLALTTGSKMATDAIIEFLLNEKRLMRNLIHVSAQHASDSFIKEIRRRLTKTRDPYVLKLYLDLMASRLDAKVDGETVFNLTRAESRDLRIAALRALSKSSCPQALSALKKAMDDKEWEVRAAACRLFGEQKLEDGIPFLIKATGDSSWWVRKNSSFALAELGALGEAALLELAQSKDQFSREIAELALKAAVTSHKAVPA